MSFDHAACDGQDAEKLEKSLTYNVSQHRECSARSFIQSKNAIRVKGNIVRCCINNGALGGSYSLIYCLGKYATEWELVKDTFDWRVLNEKSIHPHTVIEQLSNGPNGIQVLAVSFRVTIVQVPWLM